jgi:hypothetical protein
MKFLQLFLRIRNHTHIEFWQKQIFRSYHFLQTLEPKNLDETTPKKVVMNMS